MSEKKNDMEDESQQSDEKVVDTKKSKKKDNAKKSKKSKVVVQENGDNSEDTESDKGSKGASKTDKKKPTPKKYKGYQLEDELPGKIPLLDQDPVIEGTRSRKTVLKAEPVEQVVKPGAVAIPEGKGKPLGKIVVINARLQRLRTNTAKDLHRFIFGRIGNKELITSNLQKFKGFPFTEESDIYAKKLAALNKFHVNELKELLFFLDLDMKPKKKTDCVKLILDFLLLPKESENPQNPAPLVRRKRKATKRNYFESEFEEETKKRKKPKPSKETKKEEKEEAGDSKSTAKVKSGKAEKNAKNDTVKKDDEQDSSSELKKPAKKRKRNQIIEEEVESGKKESESKEDDTQDDESDGDADEDDAPPSKKKDDSKEKLSDEELRNFLKKVLADVNLESTTMKTVYNLISTEYPTYDFSKKKHFIKKVVKSLIQ